MMKKSKHIVFIAFTLSSFLWMTQCQNPSNKRVVTIGFSQCTMNDAWRVQMVNEMKREIALLGDIDFQIVLTDADNNSDKQKRDIRQLLHMGIDMLLVSPNQTEPLREIIDSVNRLDIPIVVIDRFVETQLPVTFIGSDNLTIGKMAGQEALRLLPNNGRILVFSGLKGSSPSTLRQKGFEEAIEMNPALQIVAIISGDWTEQMAVKQMLSFLDSGIEVDLVYAHNDFMARGVIEALKHKNVKIPRIIGVDGLNAPNCGIDMVLDSTLSATITYPTGGDVIIQTAYNLISKETQPQKITLGSMIINADNANIIKTQRNEIEQQYSKIDQQNIILSHREQQIKKYKKRLNQIALIFPLSVVSLIIAYYFLSRYTEKKKSKPLAFRFAPPERRGLNKDEKKFINDIEKLVEDNILNTALSVQFVADGLGMSHSTVYRKIKKITGLKCVELINQIRLNQAANLIRTTGLTMEEIAYKTGFNTASYFSTSFTRQFGISPVKFKGRALENDRLNGNPGVQLYYSNT